MSKIDGRQNEKSHEKGKRGRKTRNNVLGIYLKTQEKNVQIKPTDIKVIVQILFRFISTKILMCSVLLHRAALTDRPIKDII